MMFPTPSHSLISPGKLITKYNFSSLPNQAWCKTITPSTICSGFERCGVYPFNPNAIDCQLTAGKKGSDVHEEATQHGEGDWRESEDHESSGRENDTVAEDLHLDPNSNHTNSEKEELYQKQI